MKNWFKAFETNRREQLGIVALSLIILISISVNFIIKVQKANKISYNFNRIDSISKVLMKNEAVSISPSKKFNFDINKISVDSLILFGLDAKIAQRVVNYKKVIGFYTSINDLKKVYGMNDSILNDLELFIRWDSDTLMLVADSSSNSPINENNSFGQEKSKSETLTDDIAELGEIELNEADELMLQRIKGIGPVLSKRIVNYRNLLGGFTSVEQLYEVYGVDSTKLSFDETLTIDTSYISRINVNVEDVITLSKHPYINYYQAKLLVAYRTQHNGFSSYKQILTSKAFNDNEFERVKTYLGF